MNWRMGWRTLFCLSNLDCEDFLVEQEAFDQHGGNYFKSVFVLVCVCESDKCVHACVCSCMSWRERERECVCVCVCVCVRLKE